MPDQDNVKPAGPRVRVFAEQVPAARLRSREVMTALGERDMQLVAAVFPGDDPLPTIAAAREHGVAIALWPMLDDRHGRWANTTNAPQWAGFVRGLLHRCDAHGLRPDELCVDLEPPIASMRRALDGRFGAAARGRGEAHHRGLASLRDALDDANARGVTSWAAAVPLVLADGVDRGGWQSLLRTPIDALPLARVSVMLYSSLLVGYARGVLRRDDAEPLLFAAARRAHQRFGARASAALGAVGRGALGDEAVLRDVAELRRDVALARAAGIEDLALFDLGGALQRGPFQHWLDAMGQPACADVPMHTRRARLLWLACAGLGRVLPRGRAAQGGSSSNDSDSAA
ncbi:MAG: hypothetical protein IPH07_02785 [Deltaproteobacteria bacterium]|nr:hypothetical protein [Deltaproteobacteria bacterium]MBK8718594.1 hypothetical protein [Deltaproteobacteria bacterium]MBP7290488.1 hypothetical protein [Nannocystaceae bacterium]